MRYIRWALAWLLYWFGLLAFALVDLKAADEEPPRWWHWCFRLYNFGMCNSSIIQGESDFGPWKSVGNK